MERCPECSSPLLVSKSRPRSDIGSTEVYIVQELACPNPKCDNYHGGDLGKPKVVVKTIEHKWE